MWFGGGPKNSRFFTVYKPYGGNDVWVQYGDHHFGLKMCGKYMFGDATYEMTTWVNDNGGSTPFIFRGDRQVETGSIWMLQCSSGVPFSGGGVEHDTCTRPVLAF